MRSLFINLIFLGLTLASSAQTRVLENMGMENIRVVETDSVTYLSYEDNIYRSNAYGLAKVKQSLDTIKKYEILLLHDGLAQLAIKGDEISYNTADLERKFKGLKPKNRSFTKLDLVIYPELFLENSWLDKHYGLALNISPALEWTLWPGAKVIAQVILPLYTNMNDEKQYIRPGVIAFSQRFKIYRQFRGEIAIGNFTDDRIGVNLKLGYHTNNGRWSFAAEGGYTGSSTFYRTNWVISVWQRATWDFSVSYFEPYYGIKITAHALQMIYGDKGVRLDLSRYFGQTLIGFYGTYTASEPNGGFFFTVPLPGKTRPRRNKGFRVSYPEYFHRNYKARNGSKGWFGYTFQTNPADNSLKDEFNPFYIKKELKKQTDNVK